MGSIAFIGTAGNAVNDYETLSDQSADELHKLAGEAQAAVDLASASTLITGNNPITGSLANGVVVSAFTDPRRKDNASRALLTIFSRLSGYFKKHSPKVELVIY